MLLRFLEHLRRESLFGVDNDGQVVGIDNPDLVERSILSVFRFAIHPQSIDLCKVTRETVNGRTVVVADVLEGRHPPYFMTVSKESGKERLCYMRRGSSNYAVMMMSSRHCTASPMQPLMSFVPHRSKS